MQSLISWFEKHNKISLIITIIISIIIFYISSITFPPSEIKTFDWKPIAYHFYAFLFLQLFLLIALTRGKNRESIFLAIDLAILYAISDEIHQIFVPGRYFAILDILTDSAGILFASLIYILLRYDKLNRKHKIKIHRKEYEKIKEAILE